MEGTTQLEVLSIIIALLSTSFIHYWFTTRWTYNYFFGGSALQFFIEYSTLFLPPLLLHTLLSEYVVYATLGVFLFAVWLSFSDTPIKVLRNGITQDFKVIVLVSTCIVIAAVDCEDIFPVRFAKTVSTGYSTMDVGTGFFVALRGLDLLRKDASIVGAKTANSESTFYRRAIPFAVLGLSRSAFIAVSGYYQDPLEYGKHWNFFLTLFALELFIGLGRKVRADKLAVPLTASLIGFAYTMILFYTPLQSYVLSTDSERNNILDANKEGIFSTFGYFFIFGISYLCGYLCWPYFALQNGRGRRISRVLLLLHLISSFLFLFISVEVFGPPSRRAANFSYGILMQAYSTLTMAVVYVYQNEIGKIRKGGTVELNTIHAAVVRNAAIFFILANVLTGLMNAIRPILHVNTPAAQFLSLNIYAVVLCVSIQSIDKYRLKNPKKVQ